MQNERYHVSRVGYLPAPRLVLSLNTGAAPFFMTRDRGLGLVKRMTVVVAALPDPPVQATL